MRYAERVLALAPMGAPKDPSLRRTRGTSLRSVARSAAGLCLTWTLVGAHLAVACGAGRGTIGAMLARRPTGELAVHDVPKGLAAHDAGVQPGDQVLLIDGKDVRSLDPQQLHRALSGEVGEPVKLTLIRADRVVRVTLQRTVARQRRSDVQ